MVSLRRRGVKGLCTSFRAFLAAEAAGRHRIPPSPELIPLPKYGGVVVINRLPVVAEHSSDSSDEDAPPTVADPDVVQTLGVLRPSDWVQRHTPSGNVAEATDAEFMPIPSVVPPLRGMTVSAFETQLDDELSTLSSGPNLNTRKAELRVPQTIVVAIQRLAAATGFDKDRPQCLQTAKVKLTLRSGEPSCHGPSIGFDLFVAVARTFFAAACKDVFGAGCGDADPVEVALSRFVLADLTAETQEADTAHQCDDAVAAAHVLAVGLAAAGPDALLHDVALAVEAAQRKAGELTAAAASNRPSATADAIGLAVQGGREDFCFPAAVLSDGPSGSAAPPGQLAVSNEGLVLRRCKDGAIDIPASVHAILEYQQLSRTGPSAAMACAAEATVECLCSAHIADTLRAGKYDALVTSLRGLGVTQVLDLAAAHSKLLGALQKAEATKDTPQYRRGLHSGYATERAVVQAIASILALLITRAAVTAPQQAVLRKWTLPFDPAAWAPHMASLSPAVRRGWAAVVSFAEQEKVRGARHAFSIPSSDPRPLQRHCGGSQWFESFAVQWYDATPSLQQYAASVIQQYQYDADDAVQSFQRKRKSYLEAVRRAEEAKRASLSASRDGHRFEMYVCSCDSCQKDRALKEARNAETQALVSVKSVLSPLPHDGPGKQMVVLLNNVPTVLARLSTACFAIQACIPSNNGAFVIIPSHHTPTVEWTEWRPDSVKVDRDAASEVSVVPDGNIHVRVSCSAISSLSPALKKIDDDGVADPAIADFVARNTDTYLGGSTRDNIPYCRRPLGSLSREATAALGEVRTGNELAMTADCLHNPDVPLQSAAVASVLHSAVASIHDTTEASGKDAAVIGREWAHVANALEAAAGRLRPADDASRCVAARLVSLCEAECSHRGVAFRQTSLEDDADDAPTLALRALVNIRDLCSRSAADSTALEQTIYRACIPGLLALAAAADVWMHPKTGTRRLPDAVVTVFAACMVALRRGDGLTEDQGPGVPCFRAVFPLANAVAEQLRFADRPIAAATGAAIGRGVHAAQPAAPAMVWAACGTAAPPGLLSATHCDGTTYHFNLFDGFVFADGEAMSRRLPPALRRCAVFRALFSEATDFVASRVWSAVGRTLRTDTDFAKQLPPQQRDALARANLRLHYEFTITGGGEANPVVERVYVRDGAVVTRLRLVDPAALKTAGLPPFYDAPRATHWRVLASEVAVDDMSSANVPLADGTGLDTNHTAMFIVCGPTARDSGALLTAAVDLRASVELNKFSATCTEVPRGDQDLIPAALLAGHFVNGNAILDRRSCDPQCHLVRPFTVAADAGAVHVFWPQDSDVPENSVVAENSAVVVEVRLIDFDRSFECDQHGTVRPQGSTTQRLLTDATRPVTVLPFVAKALVVEDTAISAHHPDEHLLLLPRTARQPEVCGPREGQKTFARVQLSEEFRTLECATAVDRLRLVLAVVSEGTPAVRCAWSKLTHQETAVALVRQCADNRPFTLLEAHLLEEVLLSAESGWPMLTVAAAVVWRMAESMREWLPEREKTQLPEHIRKDDEVCKTISARFDAARESVARLTGPAHTAWPLVYAAKGLVSSRCAPRLSDLECLAVQETDKPLPPPWDPRLPVVARGLDDSFHVQSQLAVLEHRLRFDAGLVGNAFGGSCDTAATAETSLKSNLSGKLMERMQEAQQALNRSTSLMTPVVALRENAALFVETALQAHAAAAEQRFGAVRAAETSSPTVRLQTALGVAATFAPSDVLLAAYHPLGGDSDDGSSSIVQHHCVSALLRVVAMERAVVVQRKCAELEALLATVPAGDTQRGVLRSKVLSIAAQLRRELSPREWAPEEHPWWVAFEAERRIRIRPEQHAVWQTLQVPGSAVKLNMGEGKTKVIIPMLVLDAVFAAKPKVPRVAVLAQLLGDARRHYQHVLTGSIAQLPVFSFFFDRTVSLSNDFVVAAKRLFRRWLPQQRGILLWTREAIQSLHLQRHQGSPAVKAPAVKRPLDVIDECDALLAHDVCLIYATGTSRPMEDGPLRWAAAFASAMAARKLAQKWVKEGLALSASPPLLTQEASLGEGRSRADLREDLAKEILTSDLDSSVPMQLLPLFTAAQSLDATMQRAITAIAAPEEDLIADGCLGPLEPYRRDVLAIRCFVACGVAEHCLSKRHMVQYGPPDPVRGQQKKRIAVPYEAANQPSLRSEFAQSDVTVLFSFLSRLDSGLSAGEVDEAVGRLLKTSISTQMSQYQLWFKWARGEDLSSGLAENVAGVDPGDEDQRSAMQSAFAKCPWVAQFWLVHCVLPNDTREFPTQRVASGWDVNPESPHQVGFSGTDDTQDLMPGHVTFQPHPTTAIAAATGAMLQALKTQCSRDGVLPLKDSDGWRSVITGAVKSGCGAVVDTGALLAGHHMRDIAASTAQIIVDTAALGHRSYRGVYYFNADSDCWEIYDTKHRSVREAATSSLAAKDCLVIFDEARCRGADLVLHTDAVFLVTVGAGLTKDRLLQGVGRARQLLFGAQRVCFAAFQSVLTQISATAAPTLLCPRTPQTEVPHASVEDLVSWVLGNTEAMIHKGVPLWAANAFRHTDAASKCRVLDEPAVVTLASYAAPHRKCLATDIVRHLADAKQQRSAPVFDQAMKMSIGIFCAIRALDGEAERELEVEEERETQKEQQHQVFAPRTAPAPRELWAHATITKVAMESHWPHAAQDASEKYNTDPRLKMSPEFCAVIEPRRGFFVLRRVTFAVLTVGLGDDVTAVLITPREAAYAARNPTFLPPNSALIHVRLLAESPRLGGLIATRDLGAAPAPQTKLGVAVRQAAAAIDNTVPNPRAADGDTRPFVAHCHAVLASLHIGGATHFGTARVEDVAELLQGILQHDTWFTEARGDGDKVHESGLDRAHSRRRALADQCDEDAGVLAARAQPRSLAAQPRDARKAKRSRASSDEKPPTQRLLE